jgi:5,10-methenyltetrahydromethanopterin hydrogenase
MSCHCRHLQVESIQPTINKRNINKIKEAVFIIRTCQLPLNCLNDQFAENAMTAIN